MASISTPASSALMDRWIQRWIDSVAPGDHRTDHLDDERPVKRCQPNANLSLPDTPPSTEASMSASGGARIDRDQPTIGVVPPKSSHSSQIRRGKASPVKLRTTLNWLERPAEIKTLGGQNIKGVLPEDVRALYEEINQSSTWKQHIIPHELRDTIQQRFGILPDSSFRPPRSEALSEAERADTLGVELRTFDALCDTLREAAEAAMYDAFEDHWSSMIHAPLLHRIFTATNAPGSPVTARVVSASAMLIAADSSPWVQAQTPQTSSPEQESTTQTDWTEGSERSTQASRGRESKKVDYLVVLVSDYVRSEGQFSSRLWILMRRFRNPPSTQRFIVPSNRSSTKSP